MVKILVVDDNINNVMLFRCFLERGNYAVITAMSGAEAIATALEERPDLILMDLMMPIMDGFEATAYLKNNPITQHIPIIVLTAEDSSEAYNKAKQAGCDEYLLKPIRYELLLRVIEMILQSG
ncbi:MAG: response regulator [Oculatellaceae cyanobacterium bins.114]|nr:response regulator [Oculatellaceae cyanobacterium bins.114]